MGFDRKYGFSIKLIWGRDGGGCPLNLRQNIKGLPPNVVINQ